MDTRTLLVTPAVARTWLKKNINNRPMRPAVVESLKLAFMRGEFRTTHQGIAFDKTGALLDGQHRLMAISQMPDGFSVEMQVTKGLEREAFMAIDIGTRRNFSDVLKVNQRLASVSRFIAGIVNTTQNQITPQLLIPYVAAVEPFHTRLLEYSPKCTKTWSSSAVCAAAILRMAGGGDENYILLSYHALNHAEYEAMSKIVQVLHRQQNLGSANQHGTDMFLRAYKAFDHRAESMTRIQINDPAGMLIHIRVQIAKLFAEAPEKPVQKLSEKEKISHE